MLDEESVIDMSPNKEPADSENNDSFTEKYKVNFDSENEKKLLKQKTNMSKHVALNFTLDNTEDLKVIENKLLSKREQRLVIQEFFKNKFWKDLIGIFLAALGVTIAFDYLITTTGRTGLFPAGIGALARFFAIITFSESPRMQSSFYFIYYFVINVPLFIFGFLKLGKKFTLYTFLYIAIQIAIDQAINVIPYVNPTDFHLIVNMNLLSNATYSWNNGIWLFLFGALGGLLLGSSYCFVYRIGSSTGGLDFITFFISKKASKPVGSLNRNVNLAILGTVIILNTAFLPIGLINPDTKLDVLNNYGIDQLMNMKTSTGESIYKDLIRHYLEHGGTSRDAKGNLQFEPTFEWLLNGSITLPDDLQSYDQVIDAIFLSPDKLLENEALKKFLLENSVRSGYGNNLIGSIAFSIKVKFIFGPSLFASICLVLCSAMATNLFYPKFKIRTYLITTSKPKEINQLFINDGFQNDIMTWEGTNRINKNYLYRSMVMVAMSVMDWDSLEKSLFLIDPQAKVNVLKTKSVKGFFNYEIKKTNDIEIFKKKVKPDDLELEKIHKIAMIKLQKEFQKKKLAKKSNAKTSPNSKDKK